MVNIYHTGFRDQTFSELHNNQFSGFVRPELWGYDIIVIVLQICMVAEILHDILFKRMTAGHFGMRIKRLGLFWSCTITVSYKH